MGNPDEAIDCLRRVIQEFKEFCSQQGNVSEADTRAKVIDRILTQACCYPETALRREQNVECGYVDYVVTLQTRPYLAIEAKKEGKTFLLPGPTHRRSLKLSGALWTDQSIREAILQVRSYCDDIGIRYAIATNGYTWIVFRAIREDIPWKEGQAIVFPSLEYIEAHFTDFWNLLSFDSVVNGSLDKTFGAKPTISRELHRVSDELINRDMPLDRNRLHNQLNPIVSSVFDDIAEQESMEILKSCYVHSKTLRIVTEDMDNAITDAIPLSLKRENTTQIRTGPEDAGSFGEALSRSSKTDHGQLLLLLGGIGSGKTTFLKRYEKDVGRNFLESKTIWFHLDLLGAPLSPSDLELFVYNKLLNGMRYEYNALRIERKKWIKQAYANDIDSMVNGPWRHLRPNTNEYEVEINGAIANWQSDIRQYVPTMLRYAMLQTERKVVVFIDNVDQLSSEYQSQIFLLGEQIRRSIGSLVVIALREESYFAAKIQRTFTAYTNRKFHIASPSFREVIKNRIEFALRALQEQEDLLEIRERYGDDYEYEDIKDLLSLTLMSVYGNITLFIEAICFGNIRKGLQMFSAFLTSGAADVDKMLKIYRREGSYYIAFHEFVKSIMLLDRHYYKEEASPILNVFDCGTERNSSHFTCLRILKYLLAYRVQASSEGRGYVDIGQMMLHIEDLFDNREDIIRSMNRMVSRQLLEVNTHSTESISDASHLRITSSGWYYAKALVPTFCYLDLVLQDTPFASKDKASELRRSLIEVNNLYDTEAEKISRVEARFRRVDAFLSYLEDEENQEFSSFDLKEDGSIFGCKLLPLIRQSFSLERDKIRRRLTQNRERFQEEQLLNPVLTNEMRTWTLDVDGDDEDKNSSKIDGEV